MKKNLINAALLGLLVVAAPACTFVSCKDYDDDFNKVNNRLDGLEAAKNQINTEITSLKSELQKANEKATALEAKLAEKADKAALDAAVANLSAKIAEVAKLETRIAALEKAKAELLALVNSKVDQATYDKKVAEIDARLAGAESKVKLVEDKTNSLEKTLATLNEKVANQEKVLETYKTKIAALESKDADLQKQLDELKKNVANEVAALKKDVKALQDAGYQTEAQVDAKVNPVAERVTKLEQALDMLRIAKVTSLVFEPYHFEDGIESILSADFVFNAFDKLDKANDKGVVEFKNEGEASATSSVENFAVATYHVNPSNAKVDTNKDNFTFVNLRSTSRAGSAAVTVSSVDYDATKGKLFVGFHNTLPAEGTNMYGQDEINVVALSYTEKEDKTARTVVSDYARVVAEEFSDLRIGRVSNAAIAPLFFKKAGEANLLDLSAADKEERTFSVLNDGKPTKLAELVRSYGELGGSVDAIDENAAEEGNALKSAGFHYEYALVKNGADKAVDAFTIDAKTGELKVAYDADKPYQHVGKTVPVRVTLVNAQGKVATVGYFYARVTAPATVVATVTVDNELKAVCNNSSKHPDVVFDLEPITKYLAKNFEMKEADVWKNGLPNNFTIQTPGGVHEQFTVKDGVAEALPVAQRIGKLLRSVDAKGKNILTWSDLTEEKVANLRKAGQSLSATLQVIKRDDPHTVLYFTVTWAPKSIQAQPEVEFSGKPISNLWFDNQNKAGEQEQRMHVAIDGSNAFTHNLESAYLKNSIKKPVLSAAYTTDIKVVDSKWQFVEPRVKSAQGIDGKTYHLSVSEDGTKFLAQETKDGKVISGAVKHVVATITDAGVITYNNDAVAKKLLNHAGYNELRDGQTLTARVAYVTTACAGKKVLNVTEATKKYAEFDVKFLRPLNVNYTGVVNFGDANKATEEAVIDFKNSTTDWRNETKDLSTIYGNFFVGFAPESQWTTDLNGGDINSQMLVGKFGSTFGVSVATTPAGTVVASGDFKDYKEYAFGTYPKLEYKTNTANLKGFTIRIPVYVRYYWGEIKSYIDVNVGKTKNQGNARRK